MQAERDHIKEVEFPRRIDIVCKTWRDRADKAEAALAALRAERDALRKDADRWRAALGKIAIESDADCANADDPRTLTAIARRAIAAERGE